MTDSITLEAGSDVLPFYTALQTASSFILPARQDDKPLTYRLARLEITPDGSLNTFCLDGKNLFVSRQPGVAKGFTPQDFYLTRETLQGMTRETRLEDLLEASVRGVTVYTVQAIAKQLREIPFNLSVGTEIRRTMLESTVSYLEGILSRRTEFAFTWIEIHAIEDYLELVGIGQLPDRTRERVTSRRIFPEHLTCLEDRWVAAYTPATLLALVRALDGETVQMRFETGVDCSPVLLKGDQRFVLAMPIPKSSIFV